MARDEGLESERVRLELERETACEETKTLLLEIENVQAEIERVQKSQERFERASKRLCLQVKGTIQQTIDQLEASIEDACQVSPEPSLSRSHKRRHMSRTHLQRHPTIPPQAVQQEIIDISCDSDGDHAPTSALITLDAPTVPVLVPSDG